MSRPLSFGAILLGAASFVLSLPVAAQYPERPVRIIVPYAVGGANDQVARLVAAELQGRLNQSFVVENRPGAGGVVGMTYLSQAAGDGYTIAIGEPGSVSINPQLAKEAPYDPEQDFIPLAIGGEVPLIVVANPQAGMKSLADLVAYGKQNDVSYGSAGHGTVQHLTMELLREGLGIDMTHVPYRGGAPAMTDLIGGQIPLLPITVPTAMPQIQAGNIVPLAALSSERSRHLPDLATAAEQGYPSVNVTIWLGFFAPKGTSPEIVDLLSREIHQAVSNPASREKLAAIGVDVVDMDQAGFAELVRNDIATWGDIIRSSGIEVQ